MDPRFFPLYLFSIELLDPVYSVVVVFVVRVLAAIWTLPPSLSVLARVSQLS